MILLFSICKSCIDGSAIYILKLLLEADYAVFLFHPQCSQLILVPCSKTMLY